MRGNFVVMYLLLLIRIGYIVFYFTRYEQTYCVFYR